MDEDERLVLLLTGTIELEAIRFKASHCARTREAGNTISKDPHKAALMFIERFKEDFQDDWKARMERIIHV